MGSHHATTQAVSVPPYFNFLTALRGLAVVGVVFYHACHGYRTLAEVPPAVLGWVLPLINQGWFGVDVFFLISGYGLAAKLAAGGDLAGVGGALQFAGNRAWRIFPVYWLACLFALALAVGASQFNHLNWRAEFPGSVGGVLASAFLLEPFTHTTPLLPIVTWTLNCEIGFYALVTVAIVLRRWISDAVLLGLAVALGVAGIFDGVPVLRWLFAFWPQFVCGLMVFAAGARRGQGGAGGFRSFLGILVGMGAMAALAGRMRLAVAAGVGGGLVLIGPFDAAICHNAVVRGLEWLGRLSYPLFLLHVPILSRVQNFGRRWVAADRPGFLLVMAAGVALAIAVAWLIHQRVERPLLAWSKRQRA